MPYKDPQRKKEWERRHRLQRLARRRDLRRIEAADNATQPTPASPGDKAVSPWQLLGGGGALALCSPTLGLGAGALILIVAAFQKRSWQWWAIGAAIALCALFLQSSNKRDAAADTISTKT
jgi:hypothetical protein